MSSPIAELAALLVVNGLSHDIVRLAVDLAEQHAVKAVKDRTTSYEDRTTSYDRKKEYDRKRQAEIRRLRRLSEKPPLILTSSPDTPIEEVKKERRAREKKRLGPLPENWQPPDIAYSLATECGTTVSHVEAIFRDYLKSSGKLYADHDAAFCNFVRNQRKFNGHANGKPPSQIIQAADNLCRKIAEFDGPAKPIRDATGSPVVRLLPDRRSE